MELIFGTISAVVGILGAFIGCATLTRSKKTDVKTEGEKGGVVLTELGYIKKGIDGIEKRIARQENQYVDVVKHLTRVEESVTQAHKRLDALENCRKV